MRGAGQYGIFDSRRESSRGGLGDGGDGARFDDTVTVATSE